MKPRALVLKLLLTLVALGLLLVTAASPSWGYPAAQIVPTGSRGTPEAGTPGFIASTATPAGTLTPAALTATPQPEPQGCQRPPDDYTRVQIGGSVLNQRTLAMLEHAQTLYGGELQFTGIGITQGSYNEGGVALSFGTHDGGGAVDISIRNQPIDWSLRYDQVPLMLDALRRAGFAAWYRDETVGMSPHIHAIAVGDAELSPAAALQLTGRYGYFRGFDGLATADGIPTDDVYGGPVICNWMRDMGYSDLRASTVVAQPPYALEIGGRYLINMLLGETLNLRAAPGYSAAILTRLNSETPVTITDGPAYADNLTWWQIELADGTIGWAVDEVDNVLTIIPDVVLAGEGAGE